jgi:hypothetical protein
MNTANLKAQRPAVSQLDKLPCLTLKTLPVLTKPVGRQAKNLPHVSEGAQGAPAPDFKDLQPESLSDFRAMIYLNQLFTDLLPQLKVCYHNPGYVQQIENTYLPAESRIFVGWVDSFARMRYAATYGSAGAPDVVLTCEHDFMLALKLMRQRRAAEYADLKPKHINKVYDLLKLKFKNRRFNAQLLAKELFYNYTLLKKILLLLELEQKIAFIEELGTQRVYELRHKTPVHVVGC